MDRYLDDDSQRKDAHVVAKSSQSSHYSKSQMGLISQKLESFLLMKTSSFGGGWVCGYLLEHCFSLFTYWIGVTGDCVQDC